MTKITYNGKTTELADGYIATLPCKDFKMETDVVVEAPEGEGGSSSGGAELNIAYGDTAPEDTSKLWVKTSKPSAVKVSGELETKVGEGEGEITMETLSTALATGLDAYAQAQVGTKIYLFGGGSGHTNQKMYYGTYHNKIQCFDIETGTISTLAAATAGKASLYIAAAVVGAKVYLFGGKDSSQGNTAIQCFDTETETIGTLSTVLPYAFSTFGSAAVTMGTKIYLIGGCDKYTAKAMLFDTETEQLTVIKDYFIPNSAVAQSAGAGVVGTKIYLFGSYYTNGNNKIHRIDTETNTCTTLSATLAEPRGRMATLTVGSSIYLLGGMANDYTAMNKISLFDTKTETIKDLEVTLPYTYWCAGVQGSGSEVYMFGTEEHNHIVKFTPSVKTVLPTNNVQIHTQDGKNKFALIDTSALKVEVGVNKVYKGNAEGIGEVVEASLHNGTSWVTI